MRGRREKKQFEKVDQDATKWQRIVELNERRIEGIASSITTDY